LWFGDEEEHQDLNVRDTYTGPVVIIFVNDVEAFCAVLDNQQKFKKTVRTDELKSRLQSCK
jgi:hypothetical protein